MPVADSVLWLCAAIAESRPLALLIDDAQWADRSSLEVLSYLARRIDDLPLLIVVAARGEAPDAAPTCSACSAPPARRPCCTPQPLTARGAAPADPPHRARHADRRSATTAARGQRQPVAAAPNSGSQIAARGPEAIDATGGPTRVTDIARRVDAPPAGSPRSRRVTAALAEALAVIGEGVPQHVLAAVAGIPVGELEPRARRARRRRPARPATASASPTA